MGGPRNVFLAYVDRDAPTALVVVFQVAAPGGLADVVYGVIAALLIAGTVIALLSLRTRKEKRVRLLVVGVIILVAGGSVYVVSNPAQQDSIRVGSGSIGVSTSFFNVNVTSNQISRALRRQLLHLERLDNLEDRRVGVWLIPLRVLHAVQRGKGRGAYDRRHQPGSGARQRHLPHPRPVRFSVVFELVQPVSDAGLRLTRSSAAPYHFLWSGLLSPAILAAKLRYIKTMNKLPTPNAR